jgi:hypothetical protein
MAIAIEVANDKTGRAVDMTAEKMIAAAIAGDKFGKSLSRISATGKGMGITLGGISDAIAKITSVSSNFGNIVSFAESYDDLLDELNETESKMAELQEIANKPQPTGGYFEGVYYSIQDARQELELLGDGTDETKEKIKRLQQISQLEAGGMFEGVWMSARDAQGAVEELTAEAERLKGEMESLANQMVLNMFAAQIAIGGITEAELTAYMDMAVRMGEISREAADTAIDEFQRAVDFINEYEIKDRYFTIWGTVVWPSMSGPGGTSMGGSGSGGKEQPVQRSAGGIINAAAGAFGKQAYYVGEIGPEIFVPSQDGRILSNSETKAAIRSGMGRVGGTINVTINTPMNFADKAWVERELTPYINKAFREASRV